MERDQPRSIKTGLMIRDYIHVMDLAEGHKAALVSLLHQGPQKLVCNLGSGKGHSVLEVVKTFTSVSGRYIPYDFVRRRPGDFAIAVADPTHAGKTLRWVAKRTLDEMCRDSWAWQQANPSGYRQSS